MAFLALLIRLISPAPDDAWTAAKAHYFALTQEQAESCAELIALAKAGCDADDQGCYLDYIPQRCFY